MLTLTPLNLFNAESFARFTLPAYRAGLGSSGGQTPVVALGAIIDDEPAGLAVALAGPGPHGRLLSLYVRRDVRRQGIGTQLLSRMEGLLTARGCTRLEVRYALDVEGTMAFERTLQACGWPASGDRLHVFTLDGRIIDAAWFRAAVLPPSYAIAPWSTVTATDRAALADSQTRDAWIPDELLPSSFDAGLHDATSLVLRRDDAVIGWVLIAPLDDTTLHYRNLYVRPSCNRVGRTFAALALLAEAVRRQAQLLGVRSRGQFEVAGTNRAFLRFIDRHFADDLLSRLVMQRVVKQPLAAVTPD